MIRINGRGSVYGELWYDEELPGNPGVDIVLHRQSATPIANVRAIPFLSLVIDLSVKEDAIAEGFGETCRYEVRRAEAKDGLSMEFIVDPESRLDEFRAFFDAFARQKSLVPADPRWLVAACKARQLALASASRNGETVPWSGEPTVGFIGEPCCDSKRWAWNATTGEASSRMNPFPNAPESITSREASADGKNGLTTARCR